MKSACFYCEGTGLDIFFKPAVCPHCFNDGEFIEYKINWYRDSCQDVQETIKVPKELTERFILEEMMKNYKGFVASMEPIKKEEVPMKEGKVYQT